MRRQRSVLFYPILFPELKGEVRSQCARGARMMLALTCKDEHAAGRDMLTDPHMLMFALAEDGENRLFRQSLCRPTFRWVSDSICCTPHELFHIAIRTHNSKLLHMLHCAHHVFEWKTCSQCARLATTHSRNFRFIKQLAAIYTKEWDPNGGRVASNIITVEALRMNNVRLLSQLERPGTLCLESDFLLAWTGPFDDVIPFNALGCMDALTWMYQRVDPGVFHQVHIVLFENMVSQQWSFDRIVTFIMEEMHKKLGFGQPEFTHEDFLEYCSPHLCELAVRSKNMPILDATWAVLYCPERGRVSKHLGFILNSLSNNDDADFTCGRRLHVNHSMVPIGVEVSFKTFSYLNKLSS